jgi:hypothetical protein
MHVPNVSYYFSIARSLTMVAARQTLKILRASWPSTGSENSAVYRHNVAGGHYSTEYSWYYAE